MSPQILFKNEKSSRYPGKGSRICPEFISFLHRVHITFTPTSYQLRFDFTPKRNFLYIQNCISQSRRHPSPIPPSHLHLFTNSKTIEAKSICPANSIILLNHRSTSFIRLCPFSADRQISNAGLMKLNAPSAFDAVKLASFIGSLLLKVEMGKLDSVESITKTKRMAIEAKFNSFCFSFSFIRFLLLPSIFFVSSHLPLRLQLHQHTSNNAVSNVKRLLRLHVNRLIFPSAPDGHIAC